MAAEVARSLNAPLDVVVVRKLGLPGHRELAMGAVASGGVTIRNQEVIAASAVTAAAFEQVRAREAAELERLARDYRRGRPALDVSGRTVIVVDDGLATGASMRAAVLAVRERDAGCVVAAVPVGAASSCTGLQAVVDEMVCVRAPAGFAAVGAHYRDFTATSDAEVRAALTDAAGTSDESEADPS